MTSGWLRFRWIALGVLVVVMAGLSVGLKTASVPDNALTVWFLETDPQLQAYNEFHETFGNDEVILLCVVEEGGVFQPEALLRLQQLVTGVEAIEGVEQIHSLFSMQDARELGEQSLVFEQVFPETIPTDSETLLSLQDRLLDNPLFVDRLISGDGRRAMLWIQMEVMEDIDVRRDAIVNEVRDTASELLDDTEHSMGGIGVIYSGLNQITQHDFGLFIGLGYLLMFVALGVIFRSLRLVLASIGVIAGGTIAALGVYGLMGHQLNMVTVVLPTLIIVLATADAVHFPTAFVVQMRADKEAPRSKVVLSTLKHVLAPCVLTTLTTMAGFLALASAPMAVIRHLGIYSAIGIGFALLVCIVLMVVTFFSFSKAPKLPRHQWIERLLEGVKRALSQRALPLTIITLLLVGVGIWGWSKVENDTYTIGYLPDDHWVVADHEQLLEGWGDYAPLDFTVTPAEGGRMNDPEILLGMARFVELASELDEIRSGFSLYTVFQRMAEVFGTEPGQELNPSQLMMLADLLRMRRLEWNRDEPAYHDNYLAPLTSRDYVTGRLTLVGSMMSARQLAALLKSLSGLAETALGESATLTANGYPPLYVRIIDYVMSAQIRSFFLALGIIFVLMLVFLRSIRLALVSLIPNVFPVLLMMGVMGFLKIDLDIATATVAAIVIGVAIDDTVHFLYTWRQAEKEGLDWSGALDRTFSVAGRAAVITTVLLLIGFPVLMLGSVKTVYYFGLLTTIAAAAALYGDLIVLPLLLRWFGPKKTAGRSWPERKNT